jgi:hypothetical protein
MDDTFKRRVVERSMRAAVEAIEQMNLDMIEAITGLVPFSMMLRATELARDIQREIGKLPPVEADADDRAVETCGVPPVTDEDWADYEDFHSNY